MKYRGLKRAIVMLLALTMLLTSSGMATFAESLNEEATNPSQDVVATEQAEEIQDESVPAGSQEEAAPAEEAKSEEAAKEEAPVATTEDAKEEAKEEAKDEASDKAAEEEKLTAKDWEKDLPKNVSKDVREAMAQVAKSQVGDEADLYKAFANADSIKDRDASFVMFVLEYANVLGVKKAIGDDNNGTVKKDDLKIPVNADIKKWVKELKKAELYKEVSEESQPEQGDIVFTHSVGSTDAAVVLSVDEGKLTVAGIETEKKVDKVSKYTVDADKVDGFVSLKDIAPEKFAEEAVEEQTEEAKEETTDAEENAEDVEKTEDAEKADELTEEELAAKKAEEEAARAKEAAERAAKAEKEAAKRAEEEAAKAEEAGLTDQKADAELTAAPGIGGKLRSLFSSNKDKGVTISGYMPEGATVKAYPVKVKIPGQNVLAAYDITIYVKDENGNDVEWQPEIPLNVSITDKSIPESARDLSVYHMENKKAEPEQIGTVSSAAKSVEFKAESFSIYVIAEDEDTRTYRFVENTETEIVDGKTVWKGEYTQLRQTLTNGDKLVKPTDPAKEGAVFDKWIDNDTGEEFTGWGPVSGIPAHAEGAQPTKQEKILVAQFKEEKIKVTYYDQNEAILQTKEFPTSTDENPSVVKPNDKNDPNYVDYTPIQDKEGSYLLFTHWTQNPYGDKAAAGTIDADSDINLYPVLGEAHYIYFDSNSRGINGAKTTYVHSIQVAPGQTPEEADIPEAKGYTFAGWYIKSDNSVNKNEDKVFKADGSLNPAGWNSLMTKSGGSDLTYDPTLYAHWTPDAEADYTVVIWTQNLNANGTDVSDEYTFAESFTVKNVSTSSDVSLSDEFKELNTASGYNKFNNADNNTVHVARENGKTISDSNNRTDNPYYGFVCSDNVKPENVVSKKSNGSVRIMPNNSTVLNVYYNRGNYTLTFTDTGAHYEVATDDTPQQYGLINGNYQLLSRQADRQYLSTTNQDGSAEYTGDVYTKSGGLFNTRYDKVDPPYNTGSDNYYYKNGNNYSRLYWVESDTYIWVYNNREYTGTRYKYYSSGSFTVNEFTRPYGVKLDDVFPVVSAGTTEPYKDTVTVSDYWSTTTYEHCARWEDQLNPQLYTNVVAKLPYMPGQDVTFKYNSGDSAKPVTLHYMVENIEDDDTTGQEFNGKHYTEQYWFNARYNKLTKAEDADEYQENKYKYVGIKKENTVVSWTNNEIRTTDDANYYIFYDRNTPELTLKLNLDGEIKSNGASIDGYSGIYQDKKVNVKYEKALTDQFLSPYKTTGIANTEAVKSTLNGVEGQYWWYYDKECKSPVDLEHYTMPDHALTLYQGLRTGYYITVYPDGGEIGGGANTYSTIFRLDKGEKINPYENVSRDYIKVDAVPDDTSVESYWYDEQYDANDKQKRYAVYRAMDPDHTSQVYVKSPGVYSFVGWFQVSSKDEVISDDAIPYDFSQDVDGPIKLKAKWQLMSAFNIVYDAGEGVHAPIDSNTYRDGATAIVKASRGNPVGKQFRGWRVKGDTSNVVYEPNKPLVISESIAETNTDGSMTVTLEAVYEDGEYKDNYTANYTFKVGNTIHYQQTLSPGEELVTPAEPTLDGQVFTGWYEDAACKHKFNGFGTISNPVETTIYAGFANQHTATYYDAKKVGDEWVKGDNILQVQKYDHGSELDTSRVIYDFDSNRYVEKWNVINGSQTTVVNYNTSDTDYTVNSDITLWPVMKDYLLLQFDSRGGSSVEPAKIPTDGSWPNRPAEPTREGYQFLGWFTTAEQKYDEDGNVDTNQGVEYDFRGPLPTKDNGQPIDTLYAWWQPVGGVASTAEYTIIWWAQASTGDKTYEFQKSMKFQGKVGSTVVVTDPDWATEHGLDPTSVTNLTNYHSNDPSKDRSKYFEFAGVDPDAAAAVNIDPSEVSTVISDDGSAVINLRFNRTRHWIAFDTDGKGDIYYKTDKYSNTSTSAADKKYYFIEAWLDRPVADIWPTYNSERAGDENHNKALVQVTKSGETYSSWQPQKKESGLTDAGTLALVINYQMMDSAAASSNISGYEDKGPVLVYKLITGTDEKTIHFHYFKDGVEDINLAQEIKSDIDQNGNYPNPDSTFKYYSYYVAKEIEGYKVITNRDDRNPKNSETFAGYNTTNDKGEGRAQYYAGAVETTYYTYSYTRKYPNRHYYYRTGNLIHVYHELDVVIGGSGDRYDVGLQRGLISYSGTVYYRDGNSGDYKSMSMDEFKSQEFNETATPHTNKINDPNHAHLCFFYERVSYNVILMKSDGTTEKKKLSVPYGDLVSTHIAGENPGPAPVAGKIFVGWSVTSDAYEPFTSFMPARDITLYQIWDDAKVKVTTQGYDLSGDPVEADGESGEYVEKYNSLLREFRLRDPKSDSTGITFGGWEKKVEKDGNVTWKPIALSARITEDTVIRPIWKDMHAASITYDRNGGTGTIDGTNPVEGKENQFIDSSNYLLGAKAEIKSGANLTKTEGTGDDAVEYSFVCWNTKADGSGDDYYARDTVELSKHGITLYARYVAKRKVTLIYDLNTTDTNAKFYDLNASTNKYAVADIQTKQYLLIDSGDSTTAAGKINKKYEAGKEINDSKAETALVKFLPVRPGYTFKGWSRSSSGPVDVKDGAKIRVNTLPDKTTETLYAIWEEQKLPIVVYEDSTIKNAGKDGYHLTTATTVPSSPESVEQSYRTQLGNAAYSISYGYEYENTKVGNNEIDKLQYVFNDTTASYEWQYHKTDADEDEFTPVGAGPVKVTFSNGELTVTKTVTGDFADTSKEFEFTLTAVQDAPANATFKLVKGTGSPVNIGIGGTFKLKNGESAKIKLPRGKNITITETAVNGYSAGFECGDGTTAATGEGSAVTNGKKFKITKSKGALNVTNTAATGNLTISKTVDGLCGDTNQEFEFTLESVAGANANTKFVIETPNNDGDEGATSGDDSSGDSGDSEEPQTIKQGEKFKLKHGQSAVITLPQYKDVVITETAADGYTTTFTCSGDAEEATGSGSAVTNGKKLQLKGNAGALTVTNTLETGKLTITKTVDGELADNTKKFKFTLKSVAGANANTEFVIETPNNDGDEGETSGGDSSGDSGDSEEPQTIKQNGTFELKDGESAVITLPQYKDVVIVEDPEEYTAEFTCSGGAKAATGEGSAVSNGQKFHLEGTTGALNVKNTLDSSVLTVTKEVTGKYGNRTEPFSFKLDSVEGMPSDYEYAITRASDDPTETTTIKAGETFTLKHGQSAQITLPQGKTVQISETAVDRYTTTFTCEGGAEKVTGEGSTVTNGQQLKLTSGTGSLKVENNYDDGSIVPSGISGHMNMLMLIVLVFALATAEFYILIRRRRVSR